MKSSADLRFVLFWKPVDIQKKDGHFSNYRRIQRHLPGTPRELLIKKSTIEDKLCHCLKKKSSTIEPLEDKIDRYNGRQQIDGYL